MNTRRKQLRRFRCLIDGGRARGCRRRNPLELPNLLDNGKAAIPEVNQSGRTIMDLYESNQTVSKTRASIPNRAATIIAAGDKTRS